MKDTLICRCEEVTLQEIIEAITEGARTSKEVKIKKRTGMGICQGHTCQPLIDRIVAKKIKQTIPRQSTLTHNKPIRPIALKDLAKEASHENNKSSDFRTLE